LDANYMKAMPTIPSPTTTIRLRFVSFGIVCSSGSLSSSSDEWSTSVSPCSRVVMIVEVVCEEPQAALVRRDEEAEEEQEQEEQEEQEKGDERRRW